MQMSKPFGDIVYLFDSVHRVNPFGGNATLQSIYERLIEIDYRPDMDLIALTGPIATVSFMMVAATHRAVGLGEDVRVLIFDARDGGSYKQRNISIGELEGA